MQYVIRTLQKTVISCICRSIDNHFKPSVDMLIHFQNH